MNGIATKLFPGLGIILILSACGGGGGAETHGTLPDNSTDNPSENPSENPSDKPPVKTPPEYSNKGDQYLPGVRTVTGEIHDYLDTIPDCNSDPVGAESAAACRMVEYSLQATLFPDATNTSQPHNIAITPQTASASSATTAESGAVSDPPQILIIDSGVENAALRYQQRMLAMYEWAMELKNGSINPGYKDAEATLKTSQASFYIRAEILGKTHSFVPATELTRELDKQKFQKLPSDPGVDVHGSVTLNLLADYVPDAQFVTLSSLDRIAFPDAILCSADNSSLDEYTQSTIRILSDIIQHHGIDYINLSAGLTRQDLRVKLNKKCGPDAAKETYITQLHTAYGNILSVIAEQTILVQSAPNHTNYPVTTSEDGTTPDSEYFSDCMNIKNRFRTGYLTQSYLDGGNLPTLPADGVSHSDEYGRLLSPSQSVAKGCIDGYFNTGWREKLADLPSFGHYPILYSQDGLAAGPMSLMTTSFINGIGIAYIEYIAREQGVNRMDALKSLKDRKTDVNTPWMLDPMRNGELPLCSDFPAACQNWDRFILN